jgi:pimeloyl-ACP methyl ester carboxylesterase
LEPNVTSATADTVLLHGWGCNAYHFRKLLPALARRGLSAIALDLRGHGMSAKPTDLAAYTTSALVAFIERVLGALQLERVGLVGHSLGAAVALDVVLAAPERVRWLTLLNPVGLAKMTYAPLFRRAPVGYAEHAPAVVSRAVAFAALHLAYGKLGRPDPGDLEQYLYPALAPGGRFGMLAYAKAFSWEPRASEAIARIACPTHVMFGELDRVIRKDDAIQCMSALPSARIDVVSRAGHVLAEEASEEVADSITEVALSARVFEPKTRSASAD